MANAGANRLFLEKALAFICNRSHHWQRDSRSQSIFLSYARGDDEPFVARLHADLTARGFDVWWDRVSMPARGLTLLLEIREVLASETFNVLSPRCRTADFTAECVMN